MSAGSFAVSRDAVIGFGLIVLAGLYWLGADQIRVSRLEGVVGAQAVPKSLAVSLLILAALLVLQSLWRSRRAVPSAAGAVAEDQPSGAHAHARALGMLLIGAGYLVIVTTLGYVTSIALLMITTALYMGRPLSLRLVGIGIAGAVFYYVVFVRLLGIPLPPGLWPALWRGVAG